MELLHSMLQLVAVILCSNFSLWFVQERCHRFHVTGPLIVLLWLWSPCPSYSIVEEQPAAWSPCFPVFFVCGGWFFLLCERWQSIAHDTDVLCGILVPFSLISLFWYKVDSLLFTKFLFASPLERALCKPLCELPENLLWTKCGRIQWLSLLHYFNPKSVFAR